MKEFSIETLVQIIKAQPATPGHAIRNTRYEIRDFTGVSVDSRTIETGDCFFAIAGENFDGHDYVSDAFARGGACAVVSKNITGNCVLKVRDTIKALGRFAAEYRRQSNFKVVAITGSVGKTTVRQIAYHVLSRYFRVLAAPKNFNNNVGLPLTLLSAEPEDEIILAELGSNHPGEIAYLARIASPDIAVITNTNPTHLSGFGDLQTIVKEKLSISEGLRTDGVLILNADIVNRTTVGEVITFGTSGRCDIQAKDITCSGLGSRFTIDGTEVELPLPGAGNIENALAGWAVCSRFGISIDRFADALKTLPAIAMRTEILQAGSMTILNDCYNANPASMKNALDILVRLGSGGNRRLVFICGDMAELGQQTEQLHAELGASIAQAKVQLLLTVGNYAKIAGEAAKRKADYDLQIKYFKDTLSACKTIEKFIKDSDIILVKGSRCAKLETVVEKLKELFS